MNGKPADAMAFVGGVAIILNGFFGRTLWDDVDMPLADEWRPEKKPPSKVTWIFYIHFGAGLFIYGVIGFLRDLK